MSNETFNTQYFSFYMPVFYSDGTVSTINGTWNSFDDYLKDYKHPIICSENDPYYYSQERLDNLKQLDYQIKSDPWNKNAIGFLNVAYVCYETSETLPSTHGTNFELYDENNVNYTITNFTHDILNYLIKTNTISFPIKIKQTCKSTAIIIDERIPQEYYEEDNQNV